MDSAPKKYGSDMTIKRPTLRDSNRMFGWTAANWELGIWKGVAVALLIAAASTFLSDHYGVPKMLFALLIGLSMGFLSEVPSLEPGLSFSAKTILRVGVGLLGAQLGLGQVQALGMASVGGVVTLVIATIFCGVALSFLIGRKTAFGFLSGGAVAICGASAALALASVLPQHPSRDKDTVLVVITVTVLSTVAMVMYPILFQALNYGDVQSGFLIGATIHDVAQVVGAGYSINDEVGIASTVVKMLRVAMLPLILFAVHLWFRSSQTSGKMTFPWFLLAFAFLAVMRSVIDVPESVVKFLAELSQWLMVAAISAIGVRSNLGAVLKVHPSLIFILFAETLFLLVFAIAFSNFFMN